MRNLKVPPSHGVSSGLSTSEQDQAASRNKRESERVGARWSQEEQRRLWSKHKVLLSLRPPLRSSLALPPAPSRCCSLISRLLRRVLCSAALSLAACLLARAADPKMTACHTSRSDASGDAMIPSGASCVMRLKSRRRRRRAGVVMRGSEAAGASERGEMSKEDRPRVGRPIARLLEEWGGRRGSRRLVATTAAATTHDREERRGSGREGKRRNNGRARRGERGFCEQCGAV